MKSENQSTKSTRRSRTASEFWNWFRDIAGALASNVEDSMLLRELDRRVRQLDPKLSWEIGPGLSKSWQLVISPNMDRELRGRAREVVGRAPALAEWEFHSARQPKEWHYKVEMGADKVPLDASAWTFVLLQYPEGAHEILIEGKNLPPLSDDERWQAAAITLESILGEDIVLDRVDEFELVDELEPRFAERARPIQQLRDAVAGVQGEN